MVIQEWFGKHPLAKGLHPYIERWAQSDYPAVHGKNITPITRELFKWWFSEHHEEDRFHICQRRALETIIYCYEILNVPLVKTLFETFADESLKQPGLRDSIERIKHPRYGIKMATGTGKTWVMNALIVWQYWNKVKLNDSRFSSHFMLCAPGNMVYERLLDSFLGKLGEDDKRIPFSIDLNKALFMPEDWRSDFNLRIVTKEELQQNCPRTESPFVLITNWHQLMDTTKLKEETLGESIGFDMKSDSISLRVERFMDFLSNNDDLVIINDEAHHTLNASDSEMKRWQESIEELRLAFSKIKNSCFVQFDFTATPFALKSGNKQEYLPHLIYDYGLLEAMRARLVKQLFLEKSSHLTAKIDSLPTKELGLTAHKDEAGNVIELTETQKHMLDIGCEKLTNLDTEFKRLRFSKKPLMFVVAASNEEADRIAQHLQLKTGNKDCVATIHEGKRDCLDDESFDTIRKKIFNSDDSVNPVKIIVSVMMLREGFDIRNVCVLVVLRSSESPLLTEQVLGRGIRLMFPEQEFLSPKEENYQLLKENKPLTNSYDLLFVVEHPKFNQIYDNLKLAGAIIATGNSLDISLDSKTTLMEADPARISLYDISWPITTNYQSNENIDFSSFHIDELPIYTIPFSEINPSPIRITDFHPDTLYKQEWVLDESNFSYHNFLRRVTLEIIGTSQKTLWLSRHFADIARLVDDYVREYLFGKSVNFENEENIKRLRNGQLAKFIADNLRKRLLNTIFKSSPSEIIQADWKKLSEVPYIKVQLEEAISTKRCIYPYITFPPKGGFERQFVQEQLETDSFVESYVKLSQYDHKFSIQYRTVEGYPAPYYPDFIVKTKEAMLIIETKSKRDSVHPDTKSKALAAELKCKEFSKITTIAPTVQPRQWRYVLLPQDIYNEMQHQSLKAIMDRCEDFLVKLKLMHFD